MLLQELAMIMMKNVDCAAVTLYLQKASSWIGLNWIVIGSDQQADPIGLSRFDWINMPTTCRSCVVSNPGTT